MRLSYGLVLALMAFAHPVAAEVPDVADWALPDPAGALVFRSIDLLADLVDGTADRYGRSPMVQRTVKTLRDWRVEGVGPAARVWPDGLAPGRGVGLFAGGDGRFRFVIGATDPARARATLGRLFEAMELPLRLTDRGFEAEVVEFICGGVGGFLVCDSAAVPTAPPGRPAGLGADADLEIVLGPAAIAASGSPLPLQSARIVGRRTADGPRLVVDAEIAPHFRPMMAMFGDPEGDSAGLHTVDARSAGVLKLSVDGPRLLAAIEAGLGGPPPQAPALFEALKVVWSGDLVFSFAPGLLQPVVAVGLRDGEDGGPIVDGIASTLAAAGAKASSVDGVLRVEIPFDDDEDEAPLVVKLRHRPSGDSHVFALGDVELDRIEKGGVLPAMLPPDVRARGTHGLWVTGLAAGFGPSIDDVFEIEPEAAGFAALLDLLWIHSARLDTGSLTLRFTETRVRVEMGWRLL